MDHAPVKGLDGLQNFRDTGGTPLRGGGQTNPGVLFRSEGLDRLTPRGVEQLAASTIGVVVDLRTPQERETDPDKLPSRQPEIDVVQLPLLEGSMTGWVHQIDDPAALRERIGKAVAQMPTLGQLYTAMLDGGEQTFAAIGALVARPPHRERGGVLVHCTAGKDRTGIATALLLDAVGAQREAIIADYTLSTSRLAGPWADEMLGRLDALGIPRTPAVVAMSVTAPEEAITEALAWVDARGGSVAYLLAGGLTATDIEQITERLAG